MKPCAKRPIGDVMREQGVEADRHQPRYEYTDWDQVESFARKCAALAGVGAGARS